MFGACDIAVKIFLMNCLHVIESLHVVSCYMLSVLFSVMLFYRLRLSIYGNTAAKKNRRAHIGHRNVSAFDSDETNIPKNQIENRKITSFLVSTKPTNGNLMGLDCRY
jgi:hypothetical protein